MFNSWELHTPHTPSHWIYKPQSCVIPSLLIQSVKALQLQKLYLASSSLFSNLTLIMSKAIFWIFPCTYPQVIGYEAVYRVCFALAMFFFLFCVIMIKVQTSKDPRAKIQNGWVLYFQLMSINRWLSLFTHIFSVINLVIVQFPNAMPEGIVGMFSNGTALAGMSWHLIKPIGFNSLSIRIWELVLLLHCRTLKYFYAIPFQILVLKDIEIFLCNYISDFGSIRCWNIFFAIPFQILVL